MTQFIPKFIGVTKDPILIVGEKPGNTRNNIHYSLQGNRTGDFVDEAIDGRTNIILANIVNLQYRGDFDHKIGVADGIIDLIEIIEVYKPRKIICLGNIAAKYIKSIKSDIPVVELRHPSWINRFRHKLRSEYLKILSNELNPRI